MHMLSRLTGLLVLALAFSLPASGQAQQAPAAQDPVKEQ